MSATNSHSADDSISYSPHRIASTATTTTDGVSIMPSPDTPLSEYQKAIRADAVLAMDSFCGRVGVDYENSQRLITLVSDILARAFAVSETAPPLSDQVVDALRLILPMAKGYAAAHQVGSNQEYVDHAEIVLAKADSVPTPNSNADDTRRLDFLQTTVHWDAFDPEIATFDDDFWVQEKLVASNGDLRGAIDAAMSAASDGSDANV